MKNVIKIFLLTIMSLFIAVAAENTEVNGSPKLSEIEYKSIIVNGNKEFKLEKPVFKDNVKYAEVNKKINEIVDEKKWSKYEKELAKEKDLYSKPYVDFGSIITYYDSDIISILFSADVYLGGAHGGHPVNSIVINRKTGKEITSDILGSNKKDAFDKIYKIIKEDKEQVFFDTDEMEITREEIEKKAVLTYASKDIINILFNEYSVAPYTTGTPEFNYNMKTKKITFVDGSY